MSEIETIAEMPAAATADEADAPAGRPQITLLPGFHRRAEGGHPWVYSNEIVMDAAAKALPPGTLVTLRRGPGTGQGERPFGVAMFNPHTLIAARLLDRDAARAIDTSARCGCASGSTRRPITGSSMPRRTASPVLSSTGSAQSWSSRPIPPGWTG
jgi:hypothetical protein